MKTTIPCKITYSEDDKCWYVEAPGFYDGILTYGTNLENAQEMGSIYLTSHIIVFIMTFLYFLSYLIKKIFFWIFISLKC